MDNFRLTFGTVSIYCFSKATMVARACFSIVLYVPLFVLLDQSVHYFVVYLK
jgi:hypothetical protein